MTDQKSDLFQIAVLRQKGWPIQPAYVHLVPVEGGEAIKLEGVCRVHKADFDPEVWKEIERRHEIGILCVQPYTEPEVAEHGHEISRAADEARRAIDAGELSDPLPDTQKADPPPPLMRVHDPIKAPEVNWEQAKEEMKEQITGKPQVIRDAITGEESDVATTAETEEEAAKAKPRRKRRKKR